MFASFNRQLFDIIHGALVSGPLGMERAVVFGALYLPFIVAAICLVVFFIEHNRHRRHWLLVELLASVLLATLAFADNLQILFGHVRPFVLLNFVPAIPPVIAFSFPSSHASALFALAVTVRLHHKRVGDVLIFLALVNGFARVAVGVHWPIDILGGIVVGIISALIAHAFVRFGEETFHNTTWRPHSRTVVQ